MEDGWAIISNQFTQKGIAYTGAILINRVTKISWLPSELKRSSRRRSAFWVGLSDYIWICAIEFWFDLAVSLMRLKPGKLSNSQKGLHAMSSIAGLTY